MSAEMEALEKNNTWTLVKCPAGQPIVDCGWVYKLQVKDAISGERGASSEELDDQVAYRNSSE